MRPETVARIRALEHMVARFRESGITRSEAIRQAGALVGRPPDSVRRDLNLLKPPAGRAATAKHPPAGTKMKMGNLPPARAERRDDLALDALRTRLQKRPLVTVMHLCDIHFPYHYPPALELAYQMVSLHQPDLIIVGSDEFDLDLLSSFDIDADTADAVPDVLDSLRLHHAEHIDRLRRGAPNAALVFIDGNHEGRFRRWVNEHAPKLRKTLERAWTEIVTLGGEVLYAEAREFAVCDALIIRHGDRHNVHAAKSLIEQEGYQVSVIAGHTHRPQEYHMRGRHYSVVGATSGCLCQLEPRWAHGKPNGWKHGTIVARVSPTHRCIAVENVTFTPSPSGLIAITGGTLLRSP